MKKQMDLTRGSILGNMIRLALPIMFSNFMHTIYNLTDAFWLGRLESGKDAVAVVGIAFPLVFFLSSFGSGFIVAGTTLISQYRGAGETENLKKVSGQFILIILLFSLSFISTSIVFLEEILVLLQTPDVIKEVSAQYISMVLIGMFFMYIFMYYQSISLGFGDSVSPMKIQIITVVLNIVLDPLLIFGFHTSDIFLGGKALTDLGIPSLGFEGMGITGAGAATLTARVLSAILAMVYFKKHCSRLIPRLNDLKPEPSLLKSILKISIPASLGNSMTSFGFMVLQGFVNSFGTAIISVYSIGNRITSFFMMPALGISNALSSVVGQNLGAGNIKRAEKSIKIALISVSAIMFTGCAALMLRGDGLMGFFVNDPEVISAGGRMFKVTPVASFIFGIIFVYMGVFSASGKTVYNLIQSLVRLFLLRIPFVYILSGRVLEFAFVKNSFLYSLLKPLSHPLAAFPYEALWWSMIISNSINVIISLSLFRTGSWKTSLVKKKSESVPGK